MQVEIEEYPSLGEDEFRELAIDFGNQIREIRRSRGLSQDDLAVMCNARQSSISDVESGQKNPTMKVMAKIANALGVNLCINLYGSKYKLPG